MTLANTNRVSLCRIPRPAEFRVEAWALGRSAGQQVALVVAVEMNLEGLAGYIDARQLFLRDIRTISVGRPVFVGEDAVDLA